MRRLQTLLVLLWPSLAHGQIVEYYHLAAQITERSGGSWSAARGTATNAAGVWVGEGRPFGLAIDEAGKVWTTQNIQEGATFSASGSITIDFTKWTQR